MDSRKSKALQKDHPMMKSLPNRGSHFMGTRLSPASIKVFRGTREEGDGGQCVGITLAAVTNTASPPPYTHNPMEMFWVVTSNLSAVIHTPDSIFGLIISSSLKLPGFH
jgi:hypothetical protein